MGYHCPICAGHISDEDDTADVEVRGMNWETHADCMMEALNQ